MGKESEKEGIYLWIPESSCCTPKTNTTLLNHLHLNIKTKKQVTLE